MKRGIEQLTIKDLARMNIGQQRAVLKELNKEARTRAGRLVKHGYSGSMTTPPTVNALKVKSGDELIRSIQDLQIYVRNPMSRVSGMERAIDKTLTSLHAVKDDNGKSVYDFVNKSNLADFGKFMNMVREIHGAKGFPSNEVAQMFKRTQRLGISRNVIKEKFGEYLTNLSDITTLNTTLETMALPEGRKRISSTEVINQMDIMGLL